MVSARAEVSAVNNRYKCVSGTKSDFLAVKIFSSSVVVCAFLFAAGVLQTFVFCR